MNNIKLTHESLHAIGTNNGVGWNRKQLAVLGINWPPKKGWLSNLIGTEITNEQYQTLVLLRNSKQNDYKPKETSKERKPQQQPATSNQQYLQLLKRCKAELMFPLDDLTEVRMNIINDINKLIN